MTTNQTIDGVRERLTEIANRDSAVSVTVRAEDLRALLDAPYPSEAQLIAAGLGYPMSKEDAVKAYKDSLVPRTDSSSNADCEWCHGCGHDPYGEPCVGCCKPAAQTHGEPVAYRIGVNGEWFYGDKLSCIRERVEYESTFTKEDFEEAGVVTPEPLYTEQPAPVAVVMPGHRPIPAGIESLAKQVYQSWESQPGFIPWVDGGNSTKQDEARQIASRVFELALANQVGGDS